MTFPVRLYIIRHAWAGQHGDPQYPDDSQRPLTDEGRHRFAQVIKKLGKRGVAPEVVATSPYVRCRQTAALVQELLPERPVVKVREELAPGSDLERLVAWTAGLSGKDVAWVGHAPDVDAMTAALIGDRAAQIDFAKGAVAAVSFAGRFGIGWGTLEWFVTAKILGV